MTTPIRPHPPESTNFGSITPRAGKLPELLARFREHTIKIFDRHGMKSVAYWTPVDEPEKSNTLFYILYHPNREAAAANWKSFQDDPEWKSVKEKSEANGKLVDKVDSTFLALTDFSPQLELGMCTQGQALKGGSSRRSAWVLQCRVSVACNADLIFATSASETSS